MGFLENREIEVQYKGAKSARKNLPGGGPQGTVLGMFLFLILINKAGFKNIQKNTGTTICNPRINTRAPIDEIHVKWIDDMTIAEAIHLKSSLEIDYSQQHPVTFHERTGHRLPPEKSKVQGLLTELLKYAEDHEMKINEAKTNAIIFNKAKKYDFLPHLTVGNSGQLNVVDEIRILGIVVRSDLSWSSNTRVMCSKAYARLWILRRLKPLGLSQERLLDVYEKQIRCVLEFAAPVWTGGLTKSEETQIERVQKAAFAIILGKQYTSYSKALQSLNRVTLEDRRKELCLKFAKQSQRSARFGHSFLMFTPASNMNTRSKKKAIVHTI